MEELLDTAGAEGEAVESDADTATRRHGDTASAEGEAVESDADAAIPEGEGAEPIVTDDLLAGVEAPSAVSTEDLQLKALLEAIVYITEEPLTLPQIATALNQPRERVQALLDELVAEYDKPEHGVTMREVAGGYKMTTKPEHHETVRSFVRSLKPPLKLSLPALETLAVIAYKQPVTAPEIMEIRGVQGAGVLKTLLDRKLIAAAGRKNVIGKPILYKTTKDFLVQFGLKDLSELPSLKEFEEIRRMAIDGELGGTRRRPTPSRARTVRQNKADARGTAAKDPVAGGVASRRKAEQIIQEGRVTVNGAAVTELGSKADLDRDHIKVDGKLLRKPKHLISIALNKPHSVMTTVSDPQGRPTVMDLVHGIKERVYPVGRLDYASEGLLLLTNDGELANAITSASTHIPKTYLVKVTGLLTPEQEQQFREGVPLGGRRTAPAGLRLTYRAQNQQDQPNQ